MHGLLYRLPGRPLEPLTSWSKSHSHPYEQTLGSQRISEILPQLDTDRHKSFFKRWGRTITPQEYLCYDCTSVSSYGAHNEYLTYGYNRDGEPLKQINFALLSGLESGVPVYFNRLPGHITDVVTLRFLRQTFGMLELPRLHLVLDKGFTSRQQVDVLCVTREKFLLAVPGRLRWVRHVIDQVRESIQDPQGYHKLEGEVLYVHSRVYPWGKERRRSYLHLYYHAHLAATAADDFTFHPGPLFPHSCMFLAGVHTLLVFLPPCPCLLHVVAAGMTVSQCCHLCIPPALTSF